MPWWGGGGGLSKRRKRLFIERQEKWCGGQGTGALGVSQSLELDRTGAFDCFDWVGRSCACRSVLPFLSISLLPLGWGWGGIPLWRLEGGGHRLEETACPGSRGEWGRPGRWG